MTGRGSGSFDVDEALAFLEGFLEKLARYRDAIFSEQPMTTMRMALREELQRMAPRAGRLVTTVLGEGGLSMGGGFQRQHHLSYEDFIHTTVAGGNNEMQHNFAELYPGVTSTLNRAIGELSSGWQPTPVSNGVSTVADASDERVFLAHGSNSGARDTVARFLERIDVDPHILIEQPAMGRTLIESLEAFGSSGFAVIIVTADDKGGLKDEDPTTYSLRARQNVIFELGYFVGSLGRHRVVALYEDGVELPTDYDGVKFIPFRGEEWHVPLARELRAAGITINSEAIL